MSKFSILNSGVDIDATFKGLPIDAIDTGASVNFITLYKVLVEVPTVGVSLEIIPSGTPCYSRNIF